MRVARGLATAQAHTMSSFDLFDDRFRLHDVYSSNDRLYS
jgi:hypothetical protein